MNIIEEAELFAYAAHGAIGQPRAFTNGFVPYIVHPERVAYLVSTEGQGSPQMIAAAWLHDVVEDTHITLGQIESRFGKMIAEYVEWLTEIRDSTLTKAERKKKNAERLKDAPREVKIIKVADIISNMEDLVANYDQIKKEAPDFPERYLYQQWNLFGNIRDDIPPMLYRRASELLYGRIYEQELPTHTQSAGVF